MLSVVLTSYSEVWFHTCALSVNRKSNLKAKGGCEDVGLCAQWHVGLVLNWGKERVWSFCFLFFFFFFFFFSHLNLHLYAKMKFLSCKVEGRKVSISPLEGPATLDLTPQELLCNSLGWGGTAFGRDNRLRDSMTEALMFPLLAFKDEQRIEKQM